MAKNVFVLAGLVFAGQLFDAMGCLSTPSVRRLRALRYQHLVLREDAGGDPGSSLVRDRGIVIAVLVGPAVASFRRLRPVTASRRTLIVAWASRCWERRSRP